MKRFIIFSLILLLLVCLMPVYASAPGTSGDPLISLNYINNTFIPAVQSDYRGLINSALGQTFDAESGKLKEAYDGYMLRLGAAEGYSFANAFTAVSLPSGATADLVTGSTFILTSGGASLNIEKGSVINISTGNEVGQTSSLTLNERYFCTENTSVRFTATSSAVCQVDGYYKTTGTVIDNTGKYLDVKNSDWFCSAVGYVSSKGLFSGTTSITFSPQLSMTRGMFVTVLYRLAGKPAISTASEFSDVGSAALYYYNAVVWANDKQVVTGYDDDRFHPDDPITREQMAVIMYRYAAYAGCDTSIGSTSVFDSFPDKGSVSSYALEAVKWATHNGLISGSDGKLLPKSIASRAQVAQIIFNFCQKIIGM